MDKPGREEIESKLRVQRKKENRAGFIALCVALAPLVAGIPFEDSINLLGSVWRRIVVLLFFAPGITSLILYFRYVFRSRKQEGLICENCGKSLMTPDGKLSVKMGVCGNCGDRLFSSE